MDVLFGATLVDSAGSGVFDLEGHDTLSGTIPAGQTVDVLGSRGGNTGTVTALLGTVTNNGTLLLDSINSSYWSDINGGTLDNRGFLKTVQDQGGGRYIEASVINEAGATVEIGSDTRQDTGTTTANHGAFIVDPGASFAVSAGGTFIQSGGPSRVTRSWGDSAGERLWSLLDYSCVLVPTRNRLNNDPSITERRIGRSRLRVP